MTKLLEQMYVWLSAQTGLSEWIVSSVLGISLVVVTWIIYRIIKQLFLGMMHRVIRKSSAKWDDVFMRHQVFSPIPDFIPLVLLHMVSDVVLSDYHKVQVVVEKALMVAMVVVGLRIASRFVDALMTLAKQVQVLQHKPLTSYAQVIKILLYVIAVVMMLSTVLGKSPWLLLSGLGALAAVLLVVFKDPILGFTASLQLSANDMIRQGDWIEVPKYGADGDVVDVTLSTIKVRNFDQTITTVPNSALISDSFKNWRGMRESGGRRIKRAIMIDLSSVQFCTPEMLDRFEKIKLLHDYLGQKRQQLAEANREVTDLSVSVNSRRLTNVGTFRVYIEEYLRHHPKIRQDMTLMVRQLEPNANGLPLEVYAFCLEQDLVPFEHTQADIFDHLVSVVPEFGLRIFQAPSGADFRRM